VPNRLETSTSPYLLQHKDNPVDWWQWGDEAFAEAKKRGVPILLSVGYAACHWCHVVPACVDAELSSSITLKSCRIGPRVAA
jgi:uncharacterized protein YyaL (SSP411 family)